MANVNLYKMYKIDHLLPWWRPQIKICAQRLTGASSRGGGFKTYRQSPSRFVCVSGKIEPRVSFSERSCLLALLAESLAALSKASFSGLIEDGVGPLDTLYRRGGFIRSIAAWRSCWR